MKNKLIYFATNYLIIVSGMFLGFSIPVGESIFRFPDWYVFLPIGIILMCISFYFKYIYKDEK